jgi:hypothetical protein
MGSEPLPPPLLPGERTVGQLVAVTIRTYGDNFVRAVPLALPLAVLDQLDFGRSDEARMLLFALFTPFFALAFALASALTAEVRPSRRTLLVATAVGTALLLPVSLVVTWFALLTAAYLALVGLAVPAAVVEGAGPRASLRRGVELGRADYVHALGALATLVIVFFLSRQVLVALLQGQADETVRVAVFLADLVLAPIMLLGAALLYFDQAARVGSGRPDRRSRRHRRRGDADLHPPLEADPAGRPDAPVEP